MTRPLADDESLFIYRPYTERAQAIYARSNAELSKINRQGAAILVAAFLALFITGFIGAAIVDRGAENINNWMASHEPV